MGFMAYPFVFDQWWQPFLELYLPFLPEIQNYLHEGFLHIFLMAAIFWRVTQCTSITESRFQLSLPSCSPIFSHTEQFQSHCPIRIVDVIEQWFIASRCERDRLLPSLAISSSWILLWVFYFSYHFYLYIPIIFLQVYNTRIARA